MAAAYLTSEFQKSILALIDASDRHETNFFAAAPLVIDCRDDAAAFEALLSASQREKIIEDYKKGTLRYVSQLARPGWKYARHKVEERFRLLDREAIERTRQFLDDWRREKGKQVGQCSRPRADEASYGIDLLLPSGGVRLAYDLSSLSGL